MEKLLDATSEELPETMAAVRLSGMEISDLTSELSDIGLVFQKLFPFLSLASCENVWLKNTRK